METLQAIRLSFSCPKALNELVPCKGGWYCDGCHKLVHDFREKSEHEILSIFNKSGQNLCGMFEADRIRVNSPQPKWSKWLAIAVLAMGFTGLHHTVSAQQMPKDTLPKNNTATPVNGVFGVIETSAEFPGGEDKLLKFIYDNLVTDSSCHAGQKAFFMFYVELDGRLTDIKVIRSPFSSLMNKRITAMLQKSPRWKPGMRLDKPIRQLYTLPVMPVRK